MCVSTTADLTALLFIQGYARIDWSRLKYVRSTQGDIVALLMLAALSRACRFHRGRAAG